MPEASTKSDYVVGVDLGGTKILAGVFDGSLECIGTAKLSTKSQRGVEPVIERIDRCVQDAVDEADLTMKQVAGVGIGAPGAVDFESGTVIFAPNLEGWKEVPLKKDLEKQIGLPVFVENDGNIAVLGVHVAELKSKPKNVIGIFVGTGIGGGAIINGRVLHGLVHPEMGHIRVPHDLVQDPYHGGCPYHGDCLEGLASGPAMQARWGKAAQDLPPDHPAWILEGHYLAHGLANWVLTLSPQRIVLGGGVARQSQLFKRIRQDMVILLNGYVRAPEVMRDIDQYVVPPQLGGRAGVLGGLVLAEQAYTRLDRE